MEEFGNKVNMTKKQQLFYDKVKELCRKVGYPSWRQMMEAAGYKSVGSAYNMVKRLESRGFIERDNHKMIMKFKG